MTKNLLLLFLLIAGYTAYAQENDKAAVQKQIEQLRKESEANIRRQTDSILQVAGIAIRKNAAEVRRRTELQIKALSEGKGLTNAAVEKPAEKQPDVLTPEKDPAVSAPAVKSDAVNDPVKTEPGKNNGNTEATNTKGVASENGERITFSSSGISRSGFLYKPIIPKKDKYPLIVVIQAEEDESVFAPLYTQLVQDMNKIGFSVFIYKQRRAEESTEKQKSAQFSDLALDASSAIDLLQLRNDVDTSKIGLFSASEGASVAGIVNSLRNDIAFNVMISPGTMSMGDQMNYAVFNALQDNKFTRAETDSAIRLRTVVDDYYRGRMTYDQVLPFVTAASASKWYKYAAIPELVQPKENSPWFKKMNFDPLSYYKYIKTPVLVIYGEEDRMVSVDKGIYDWKQLNLTKLVTKRIDLTGHRMIDFEKDNPAGTTISGMYRNFLESWIKKQQAHN